MPSTPSPSDPTPLRILALAGSLRRGSWNRRLLEAAAAHAPPGITVTVDDGLRSLPLFDEDLEADDPAPVRALRQRVADAGGLLIATPEYNQGVPGVLKNGVDWLSRPHGGSCLEGKPAAVLGATPGAWGTRIAQKELRHVLWATEALVLPHPPLYLRNAADAFDDQGRLVDDGTRRALTRLLAAFEGWIRSHPGR